MGGLVALRALLALGADVRGASVWSSSLAPLRDRARHHAARNPSPAAGTDDVFKDLKSEIAALPFDFDPDRADPAAFLGEMRTPLNLHHAVEDPVTPFEWSETTADELSRLGHRVTLYTYSSADHLFTPTDLQRAIDRDVRFFQQLMN
jgi:predicted esterase